MRTNPHVSRGAAHPPAETTSYWSFAWGGAVINETMWVLGSMGHADASVSPPSDLNGGECDQRRSELRRHSLTHRRDLSTQIAKFERAWPAGPTTEHPTWRGNDTLVTLLIGQNDVVRVTNPPRLCLADTLRKHSP